VQYVELHSCCSRNAFTYKRTTCNKRMENNNLIYIIDNMNVRFLTEIGL